ncbi:hypothetical protein [Nostoc sp. TCL240-02]|uniref:hypothetical protein n=1 Tax=Nostoc sp. TCL240-02 TaxID=2572090 RepID=UPI00157F8B2C|nr:hypothetical protein [Nostoc sp. TCL240-02]QKQ73977.1 hypothetical protein FBB35_12105 [Nostoc sp. TCL240-02]
MIIGQVFERFVEESPVSVMVRGLLETILCSQKLDELFEKSAKTQCTLSFLSGIVARKDYFIIREHQFFSWYDASEFRHIGSVEGGKVFEQTVKVSDDKGYLSNIRRVKIILDETNRDGDSEIFILTNLPTKVANCYLCDYGGGWFDQYSIAFFSDRSRR